MLTATGHEQGVYKMYEYNDGLLPGSRHPRLYLAKAGKAIKFTGENIPEYCAIASAQYEKRGKWSNTTYLLALAPGVRPIKFVSPMHGVWGDSATSWGEIARELMLPIEEVRKVIRQEYRGTAERLDKIEEFALAVEAEGGTTTEIVVISFGSPTNREIHEGWWGEPKYGEACDGLPIVVEPSMGESGPNWEKPVIVEPSVGATIIGSSHFPGMHGGYYHIEVAVMVTS